MGLSYVIVKVTGKAIAYVYTKISLVQTNTFHEIIYYSVPFCVAPIIMIDTNITKRN